MGGQGGGKGEKEGPRKNGGREEGEVGGVLRYVQVLPVIFCPRCSC